MSSKVMVIISTAEKDKALTGTLYAKADKSGASSKLEELGINVEYVGALISDSIIAGYIPMVF